VSKAKKQHPHVNRNKTKQKQKQSHNSRKLQQPFDKEFGKNNDKAWVTTCQQSTSVAQGRAGRVHVPVFFPLTFIKFIPGKKYPSITGAMVTKFNSENIFGCALRTSSTVFSFAQAFREIISHPMALAKLLKQKYQDA